MSIKPQNLIHTLATEDAHKFIQFGAGEQINYRHQTVLEMFQEMASLHPNSAAVRFNNRSISYRELDQQSDSLANSLIKQGIKPEQNVGLFLERSIEMVVGMLGILKSGAAYVPQDIRLATQPLLSSMIEDAKISTVLSLSKFRHKEFNHVKTIYIDEEKFDSDQTTKTKLPQLSPSGPCFILFTSGTTGKPNGVEVLHKNFANLMNSKQGSLNVKNGERVSQLLNISFDMASWEIFAALTNGAELLIRGKDIESCARQANVVISTPGILSTFNPERFKKLRAVAVAGEPCPIDLANKWAKKARFYNSCGPTEICIINTMTEVFPDEKHISIGSPIPNTNVYILDKNLTPVPIGEVGEMWVGGDGVSRGYLSRPELNKERYVEDPFTDSGHKMFRTRDLAKWTKDGKLVHLGRTDDQVKIKGFRVELEAISAVLQKDPKCQAAVSIKLDSQTLVSFVRPINVDTRSLKNRITNELPYFYEPKQIIALNTFPLTDRGKVDKRQLALIAANEISSGQEEELNHDDSSHKIASF